MHEHGAPDRSGVPVVRQADNSAGWRIKKRMEVELPMPSPQRLYVIGDVHGRRDLLDLMIDAIARDLDTRPAPHCLTVTVGDYIDRGPDSRGVLERLAHNPFPTDFVALKGNHEALFATFLRIRRPPIIGGASAAWRRCLLTGSMSAR